MDIARIGRFVVVAEQGLWQRAEPARWSDLAGAGRADKDIKRFAGGADDSGSDKVDRFAALSAMAGESLGGSHKAEQFCWFKLVPLETLQTGLAKQHPVHVEADLARLRGEACLGSRIGVAAEITAHGVKPSSSAVLEADPANVRPAGFPSASAERRRSSKSPSPRQGQTRGLPVGGRGGSGRRADRRKLQRGSIRCGTRFFLA